jgi:hypothetical protein
VLSQEMSQAESDTQPVFSPVPRSMEYVALAFAVASLLLGLRAIEPLTLLRIGSPLAAAVGGG